MTFNAFLLYYYKKITINRFFYNECTIYIYKKMILNNKIKIKTQLTMKNLKQYLKSAFYAFFTLAGMVFELPSTILYGIADYFYVAPDENNEEENDEE